MTDNLFCDDMHKLSPEEFVQKTQAMPDAELTQFALWTVSRYIVNLKNRTEWYKGIHKLISVYHDHPMMVRCWLSGHGVMVAWEVDFKTVPPIISRNKKG